MDVPLPGNVRTGAPCCNQVAQASGPAARASGAQAWNGPQAGTSARWLSGAAGNPMRALSARAIERERVGDPAFRRHLGGMDDKRNQNEGEGSKTADKKYREAATDYAKRTDTEQAGLQAEREVEERKSEFDQAEQAGRSHSKGELPDDLDGTDFDRD